MGQRVIIDYEFNCISMRSESESDKDVSIIYNKPEAK